MDYIEVVTHCEKRRDQAGVNPLPPEDYEKAILMMAYLLNDKDQEIADQRREDYRRSPY